MIYPSKTRKRRKTSLARQALTREYDISPGPPKQPNRTRLERLGFDFHFGAGGKFIANCRGEMFSGDEDSERQAWLDHGGNANQ